MNAASPRQSTNEIHESRSWSRTSSMIPENPRRGRTLVLALLLALPGLVQAGPDRSDVGPRVDSAPLAREHLDYLHSVRCGAELFSASRGAESYQAEVMGAPEFSLRAQEVADATYPQSWFLPPVVPVELYVGARELRESVECGQDGPVSPEVPEEVLRVMPDLSLRSQEALGARQVPEVLPVQAPPAATPVMAPAGWMQHASKAPGETSDGEKVVD